MLLAVMCLIAFQVKRYRQNAWRRQACKELQKLKEEALKHSNNNSLRVNASKLAKLIKQVLAARLQDEHVKSKFGTALIAQISQYDKKGHVTELCRKLYESLYCDDQIELTPVQYNALLKWIRTC